MSEPRLPDLARSFERHLRAENNSDRTVQTYLEAVRLLQAYLARRGVGLAEADRTHIEAFLADLLARWKPATAANRYRSLRVFYAWAGGRRRDHGRPDGKDEAARNSRAADPCRSR
jgi:site-specific recombinase XerD